MLFVVLVQPCDDVLVRFVVDGTGTAAIDVGKQSRRCDTEGRRLLVRYHSL